MRVDRQTYRQIDSRTRERVKLGVRLRHVPSLHVKPLHQNRNRDDGWGWGMKEEPMATRIDPTKHVSYICINSTTPALKPSPPYWFSAKLSPCSVHNTPKTRVEGAEWKIMATGMNKEKFLSPLLVILTPLPFENIPLECLNFREVFKEILKKYSM